MRAGSTPPAWAAALITNPLAWADESDSVEATEASSEITVPVSTETAGDATNAKIPPVKGKGSSAEAWAAYAKSQGFEVEADAKASEIREALIEAGVPVE